VGSAVNTNGIVDAPFRPNHGVSSKPGQLHYTPRHAAYDLRKLRGKGFVERVGTTRCYEPTTLAIGTLVALLILREKVIKPVLAGAGKPKPGRPPKRMHPLDVHYENLQSEMRRTFRTLGLAA
jgi:hypothetical protein